MLSRWRDEFQPDYEILLDRLRSLGEAGFAEAVITMGEELSL
jgi:hypothetical protein